MSSTGLGGMPHVERQKIVINRHYFILPHNIEFIRSAGTLSRGEVILELRFKDYKGCIASVTLLNMATTFHLKSYGAEATYHDGYSILNYHIFGKSIEMACSDDGETRLLGISLMQNIIDNEKNKRGIKAGVS